MGTLFSCTKAYSDQELDKEDSDLSPIASDDRLQLPGVIWPTVEEATKYLKDNFLDVNSSIVEASSVFVKGKLRSAYPLTFDEKTRLSLPHHSDQWQKLPDYRHLGVYLVAAKLVQDVVTTRWLLYIEKNKIRIVEVLRKVRRVKPQNVYSWAG